MKNLGLLYEKGQGVPQSYERAVELYKQSAAQGNPVSQRDQAHFHEQYSRSNLNYERKNTSSLQAILPHQAY